MKEKASGPCLAWEERGMDGGGGGGRGEEACVPFVLQEDGGNLGGGWLVL